MAENTQEIQPFRFANKVDIHAMQINIDAIGLVALAYEHEFRGVVVDITNAEYLCKAIKNSNKDENYTPISICAINYPFGNLTTDIRCYSIMSAKEKGIDEIEIVLPYHLIINKEFNKFDKDIQSVIETCNRADLKFKYVIDPNVEFLDDGSRTRIYKILSSYKLDILSNSLGFFDGAYPIDHSNNILGMRYMKNKVGSKIKCFIGNKISISTLSLYIKAGADMFGIEWQHSPNIVHEYEYLVNQKLSNNDVR